MQHQLPLVINGSPRTGGNSHTAAVLFAKQAGALGHACRVVHLREYSILGCTGCGACEEAVKKGHLFQAKAGEIPLYGCPLGRKDDSAELIHAFVQAPWVCFVAPIYMYHLPALSKAFLDRLQPFWNLYLLGEGTKAATAPLWQPRPFLSILAAGREKGDKLFTGALRTLRWAVKPLAYTVGEVLELRGADGQNHVKTHPAMQQRIEQFASNAVINLATVNKNAASASGTANKGNGFIHTVEDTEQGTKV